MVQILNDEKSFQSFPNNILSVAEMFVRLVEKIVLRIRVLLQTDKKEIPYKDDVI